MITVEHAIIISSIIGSLTYCSVKVCQQIQQSRCSHIEICCCKIEREVINSTDITDVNIELPEIPTPHLDV